MARRLAEFRQSRLAAEAPEALPILDPQEREQLKALGYARARIRHERYQP
jgi:hypothetical protein